MKKLNTRATAIAPSPTLAINALANKLISEGKDILKFGIGETDFNPSENMKEAAIEAVRGNNARYTAVTGLPELKNALCEKLKRENNLEYNESQVIIGNGAKQCLFNAMLAMLNNGDEVIIPKPAWVTFREQVEFAGGIVKWVETDENYKLHANSVKNAIGDKTKAILINSPSNPTGAVFENSELEKIVELAIENDLYIISDECYEHFVYGGKKFRSIASFGKEAYERTITINAASKAYAITGWRIGYAAGPENVIKTMGKIQGHSTSNPCNISQLAVVEALNGQQDTLKKMVNEFGKRREYTIRQFNGIPGMNCPIPEGAFYAFPNVSSLYKGEIRNSVDFCNYLLENAGVAVVPGKAFEADECIRFSYASSMESIKEGILRIKKAVEKMEASG